MVWWESFENGKLSADQLGKVEVELWHSFETRLYMLGGGHMGRGKRVERYLVTWFFAMSWLLEWQSSQVCVVLLVFGPPFAASHIIRLCCLSSVQVSESESKWWVLNQNADTRIKKPNAPCLLHSTEINLDWPYFLTP